MSQAVHWVKGSFLIACLGRSWPVFLVWPGGNLDTTQKCALVETMPAIGFPQQNGTTPMLTSGAFLRSPCTTLTQRVAENGRQKKPSLGTSVGTGLRLGPQLL